jgi:thiamine pyrophosphokinase
MNENFVHEWRPFEALNNINSSSSAAHKHVALVILNQPITENLDLKIISLWRNSSIRICVDGGLNQLFYWQKRALASTTLSSSDRDESQLYFPDYVCGDLDSADIDILKLYEARGSIRIQLYNQDLTDFEKTLRFAVNCIRNGQLDTGLVNHSDQSSEFSLTEDRIASLRPASFDQIYTVCDFGGRLDHAISNLNTLYSQCVSEMNAFILSSESVTFLLKKGLNVIYADDGDLFAPARYCGFFPFGREAVVSTYGLKWNLTRKTMKFGSFVSSSNEFSGVVSEDEMRLIREKNVRVDVERMHVIVVTDEQLIWTMYIK